MRSCPWSIWDSFRCLYRNTPKRSFGGITIKIHNKINYLKVPTYDVIDSLPVAVCDNRRIRRSKIYSTEEFRGYQASKKRYFYGLKIHLMVTQDGQPVACFLTPGGFGDVDALKYYAYKLPDGSIIYADNSPFA